MLFGGEQHAEDVSVEGLLIKIGGLLDHWAGRALGAGVVHGDIETTEAGGAAWLLHCQRPYVVTCAYADPTSQGSLESPAWIRWHIWLLTLGFRPCHGGLQVWRGACPSKAQALRRASVNDAAML